MVMEDVVGREDVPQLGGIAEFLADLGAYLFWNQNGCGKHKTTDTARAIVNAIRDSPGRWRFIVCAPTFRMLEGLRNWEDLLQQEKILFAFHKGKGQFCPNKRCYYPGCKRCVQKTNGTCGYWQQELDVDVILTAFEDLDIIPPLPNREDIVVIEECPDRMFVKTVRVPDRLRHALVLENVQVIQERGANYAVWEKVSRSTHFRVNSVKSVLLKHFMTQYNRLHALEYDGHFHVFGVKKQMVPPHVRKVLVNDFTMPEFLLQIMFYRVNEFWKMEEPEQLRNPTIRVRGAWGVQMCRNHFATFQQFVVIALRLLLQSNPNVKIFIVTKEEFERQLDAILSREGLRAHVDLTHHGTARGTNDFDKEYELAIEYGAFHRRPVEYLKWRLLFPVFPPAKITNLIRQMELADERQGYHRTRPIKHPYTPFLLFTPADTWEGELGGTASRTVIDDFVQHPMRLQQASVRHLRASGLNAERITNYRAFLSFWEQSVLRQPSLEDQVRGLQVRGLTLRQIARNVGRSVTTVKRILRRRRVNSEN